jgi:hypothetical protein
MILKSEKLVASPARHSLMSSTIELMLVTCEVNGAEMEASVCERERPISACFSAPQSLAPSPHIDTFLPICWKTVTILALSLGLVRAKTVTFYINLRWMMERDSVEPGKMWLKARPVTHNWQLFSSAFTVMLSMNC